MDNNTFQDIQYRRSETPTLTTTNPFQQRGISENPFSYLIPTFGKAAAPYIREGNKHLSEETMIAIKGYLAKQLKTRLGVCTMQQLNQATKEIMAIAESNKGTEWYEYINAFAMNYLNFLQQQLANTSEVTMEHIDSVVQRPIVPPSKSWFQRTFSGSND
jgi:hypothetical protein